ncbi:hypothetical protein [Wolbachia endosymbiont of Wiebesia pumilae]|uniref:hypothetical protein n=1 Tax=Wolbachia endosymbiont of Wiebesia pumilae TaxID=2742717 RepID=UPI001FD4AE88|nr:hypothetical protein [Wolbachia endosymbiont of Wiebesia pumilae]
MHGLENGDNVTPTSYTKKDEDGKKVLPTPAPRSTVPRTNDKNEISHSTSPFDGESDDKETANLNMEGSVGDGSEEPIYATIDPDTKSSKKSLDSGIDGQNSILSRSPSQETVFDDPDDLDKTLTRLSRESSNKLSNVPSTSPPSYKTDDSEESLSLNSDVGGTTNKKTNRFLPRAKYSMQQKGFIIFTASAIILSISAALLYLQDKAKFIAFFTNSPKYITIPVIALAALLAIGPIFFATRQFIDTEEHSIQKKDADKILAEVLEHQPKDKAIKSVRLEYSNGTHSNFVLNAWEAKQGFTNIDEKVITRTNKISN